MENFYMGKIIKALAVFIFIAGIACFSGCGVIAGTVAGDAEDLTFASRGDYTRNDILVDGESHGQNQNPTKEIPPQDFSGESENNGNNVNPAEPPPNDDGPARLSFLAAGDNIMHMVMIEDAHARASGGEDFNFIDMYKDVAHIIKAADIALVNAETPIAGGEFGYSGYPMFNTPEENGRALVGLGFDIINLANNHMLDKGEKGYKNHLDFWDAQPVLHIGGFRDREDFESVRIYEKNGVSIAFLSYTYSTNGMTLPSGSAMVIPLDDAAVIERQVKAARPLADLLFVVMHWGDEDAFSANSTQKNLARMMADNGVDVIIGMHPHVFQETQWLERAGGGRTLVAYSIGNFISGMLGAKNMIGGFLGFDIVKGADGLVTLENARITPVMTHYGYEPGRTGPYNPVYKFQNGRLDFQVYRFEDYTRELAAGHGVLEFDKAFSYDYIKNLIKTHVPQEFLSDFYKD